MIDVRLFLVWQQGRFGAPVLLAIRVLETQLQPGTANNALDERGSL